VLELCPEVIELCREVARIGLEASLSDAGVGVQMARAAAAGAYQNVCINMAGLGDKEKAASLTARADVAWERAKALHVAGEEEILQALRVQSKA
jgi:formiminotetrahydrofolate cyclodeaminase